MIPLFARRWPVAVAAAFLAIAAVGAGSFAAFGGSDDHPTESAVDIEPSLKTTSTLLSDTLLSDLEIPDVVGLSAADAAAQLEEAGFETEYSVLYVDSDDPQLGNVTEVIRPAELTAPGSRTVQIVIARLAASTMAQARCDRPAYSAGDFDDDGLFDAVYARYEASRISAVEVCTGAGVADVLDNLDFAGLSIASDIDLGGFDDIVATVAGDAAVSHILTLRSGEIRLIDTPLRVGPRGDGTNDWWGCYAFARGAAERFGIGRWWERDDGTIAWEITETYIGDDSFSSDTTVGGFSEPGDLNPTVPGRLRCEPDLDQSRSCPISDLRVAMFADVDGDGGRADLISPRDNLVCLANGIVVQLDAPANPASIWFFDDVDDDGRPELFIGDNNGRSISVRPYGIDSNGALSAAAIEDCCVQDLPTIDQAVGDWYRWFSCVSGEGESAAGITSGRYRRTAKGTVEWTIGAGPGADAEIIHEVTLEPDAWGTTDAWIPGNGCRSGNARWGVTAEHAQLPGFVGATDDFVAAFNAAIDGDDPDRRVVQLRQALDIGRRLESASGYREDVVDGFFEISGLRDDSVAAERWGFSFSDDGTTLIELSYAWSCQPDRGHQDFTTELCL